MDSARNKVAICVAAATLAAGAVVVITPGSAAHAATVACGSSCVEPYSQEYGTGSIAAVDSGTLQVGLGVGVGAAGAYPAEDFEVTDFGPVSDFYEAGLVGPVVGLTWPTDQTYEFFYAPGGVQSGLCLGLADSASTGEGVTLQECGVDANTVWIGLAADESDGYQPLINATDTSADAPDVLTVLRPRLWLRGANMYLEVDPLSVVYGAVSTAQMWANESGAVG
jgi:hypothetical protein